jgi:putative Ca2+/H+ antiporter (TMEM165/GDT1 family)
MRYNKLTVFLGAISSLVLMTVVSALLGYGVTSLIPKIYTFYASIVIMFIFGFKMFYDAWKMKPNEAEELQQEAEEDINRRERRGSERNVEDGEQLPDPDHEVKSSKTPVQQFISSMQFWKTSHRFSPAPTEDPSAGPRSQELQTMPRPTPDSRPLQEVEPPKPEEPSEPESGSKPESSRFGKQCLKIFKVFVNAFGLIFLAEWGDRSQLATIVLASVNDVAGVILGGVLGHTFCTGLAILSGALIAKKISVRAVTIIGGIVFIGFAIATIIYGPESDEEFNPETTTI